MSSDIKRRLRDAEVGEAFQTEDGSPELQRTALGQEAAARIEALEGEVAALKRERLTLQNAGVNLLDRAEAAEARAERLEGEVADSLPWKLFYKDGLDLKQIGGRLNVDPYSLSPWLYAPLLKQDGHPYQAALKAAEARAERLRVALEAIANHWANQYDHPNKSGPMYEGPYGIGVTDGHRACTTIARKALSEDDKQ